jgi:hypothetical protein
MLTPTNRNGEKPRSFLRRDPKIAMLDFAGSSRTPVASKLGTASPPSSINEATIDRWQFQVQPESFFVWRLTLGGIFSAGNMVFHSPLDGHESKAL